MGEGATVPALADDVWELYDTTTDLSQARDLSSEMPEKLAELQQLFLLETAKYNVFPIDDRTGERFNATIAGRPELQTGRKSMRMSPGMTHMGENTVLNVKNRSHTITAQFEVGSGGADGVLVAQGGTGTLLVNGAVVAEERIDKTVPFVFSADETMDIGEDSPSPVTSDYPAGDLNKFAGDLAWVQIDIEEDDVSHMEAPEATYHRILARQ